MTEVIKPGWHFTTDRLSDGSPIPPVGEWLRCDGDIVLHENGLHMNEHPLDALQFAPGPILHRVELRGDLTSDGDRTGKWVGRERRIRASHDVSGLLCRCAKDQALRVAHEWGMPGVVREYLESDSEELRDAARAAVIDLPRNAAWHTTISNGWEETRFDVELRINQLFGNI